MSAIRKLIKGGYQADFQHKCGGIPRTKRNFVTQQEAKQWLTTMRKKAEIKRLLGEGMEDVADKMFIAAEAVKNLKQDNAWYSYVWSELRAKEKLAVLFVKYEGKCVYCGKRVEIGGRNGDGATKDHIVPVSGGGSDALDNLTLACRSCNTRKLDRPLSHLSKGP